MAGRQVGTDLAEIPGSHMATSPSRWRWRMACAHCCDSSVERRTRRGSTGRVVDINHANLGVLLLMTVSGPHQFVDHSLDQDR